MSKDKQEYAADRAKQVYDLLASCDAPGIALRSKFYEANPHITPRNIYEEAYLIAAFFVYGEEFREVWKHKDFREGLEEYVKGKEQQ